jgi:hypothetical protein
MRSRPPSVARLAATARAARAVTGAADPRCAPAVNTPDRQSMGTGPAGAGATPRRERDIEKPPVVQIRCGRADQRARPRPLRYLMVPYAGAFPQRQSPSIAPSAALPTRAPRRDRPGWPGTTGAAQGRRPPDDGTWCLFQARRANIESFARDLEARSRARATITRRLCTVARFYRYAVEEELLAHSRALAVHPCSKDRVGSIARPDTRRASTSRRKAPRTG